jgi:hypothetical protein
MAMKLHLNVAMMTVALLSMSGLPVVAQSAVEKPTTPVETPITPAETPIAPATTPVPPRVVPMETPAPTMPKLDRSLPKVEAAPSRTETVPYKTEAGSAANSGVMKGPGAKTMVLPQETITGIKMVDFGALPVRPINFTLPMMVAVAKGAGSSDTPISDRYTAKETWDVKAWGAAISGCLQQKPKLVRVVGDEKVPFMIDGAEGTIMLNANDKSVCAMS